MKNKSNVDYAIVSLIQKLNGMFEFDPAKQNIF